MAFAGARGPEESGCGAAEVVTGAVRDEGCGRGVKISRVWLWGRWVGVLGAVDGEERPVLGFEAGGMGK